MVMGGATVRAQTGSMSTRKGMNLTWRPHTQRCCQMWVDIGLAATVAGGYLLAVLVICGVGAID